MPLSPGVRVWVKGKQIRCVAADNMPLLGIPVFVDMPTNRTADITQDMNLPDDAIETVFDNVVQKLTQRYQQPKDIIRDNLPAGNNTLKS